MTRRTRLIAGGVGWALVAAMALALWARSERASEPEVLMPIAPFELVDQDGRAFGSAQLRGQVWIAGFAFTSCTSICPMLTSQMANLQRRLAERGDDVQLVTITVDPETDTPARMRAYAEQYRADLRSWSFLTGEPQRVRETIEQGFRRPIGARRDVEGGYDILHSGDLMLVDRDGMLRGIYPTDQDGLDALMRDVGALR
ncbi:SCO family protein [Sandaracinus amylolyticus]|uniref:Cytochrome oxidase biogenesis protein Sco1/SenC/PrrC n=1 Tax=Sandaracinus amylolyticus TaxID=927083 RepID=A0A0F6W9D3_9BACT|nr:SCO family protein [Sandaracinus amylolyticus]AKF10683.1 Cytochrome oxidase biogenesis protein Sco1/SenC/PrrC [Sandaracinus amylolyticus]